MTQENHLREFARCCAEIGKPCYRVRGHLEGTTNIGTHCRMFSRVVAERIAKRLSKKYGERFFVDDLGLID